MFRAEVMIRARRCMIIDLPPVGSAASGFTRQGKSHVGVFEAEPAGGVPTLLDDGEPLIESSIICEYLEDRFPQTRLRPRDARDTAAL